jgi:hypothetical protein
MKHLRNLIAVIVLIGVIYAVTNYSGQIQEQIGVKGASTSRAQEIAGNITHDVGSQVDSAKNQAMHINVSDVLNYLSRFKRVPQDIISAKDFIGQQVSSISGQKKERVK